jgi:hypothetical protein
MPGACRGPCRGTASAKLRWLRAFQAALVKSNSYISKQSLLFLSPLQMTPRCLDKL